MRERNPRRGPVALALAAAAIYAIAAAGIGQAAVPKCNGLDVTVGGATQGPDTLVGTAGDDVIAGLGGDDTIVGRGGDDTICGDAGTDNMLGGAGGDTIIGHNRDPSSGLPPTFEKGDVAAPGPGDDLTAVRGLDYSRAAGPIRADLGSSVVTGEGTDQVPGATRAERIRLRRHADRAARGRDRPPRPRRRRHHQRLQLRRAVRRARRRHADGRVRK